MIKVILVDDKEMFRTTLKSFLQENPEIAVIGNAENGKEALDLIKTGLIPDIMLLDIEMPILNGLRTLIELRKFNNNIGVIILSMHYDVLLVEEFKNHGANGFVTKDHTTEILLDAIKKVKNGDDYFENVVFKKNNLREAIINSIRIRYNLSNRELEILVYVCKGLRNKEISDILCIAERTVETHKTNIFRKTGVTSSMELMLFAVDNDIVAKNLTSRNL